MNGIIQELIEKYDLSPPIDVNEIVEKEHIHFSDEFDIERLSEAGYIHKTLDKTKIWVNPMEAQSRQRFTMAHELGHYFLHLQDIDEKEFEDGPKQMSRNGNWDAQEYEANNFAGRLLMPAKFIAEAVDRKGLKTIAELAKYFKVSEQAMTYRMNNLSLSDF